MGVKPLSSAEFIENLQNSQSNSKTMKSLSKPAPDKKIVSATPTVDQDTFLVSREIDDPAYNRHVLPSRGFFYEDKKDIVFRSFRVGDLKKIQHFLQTDNISHLIDAIQNCLEPEVDVRELTLEDFLYIVFKIVFSSHTTPEYNYEWTSFYGNACQEVITPASLAIQELDYKTLLEKLPDYSSLGFMPKLVKYYEALHNNRHDIEDETTWDVEKTWLYEEVASYLKEDSLEEQFNRAEAIPVNSEEYKKLKQFKQLSRHSIKTELLVRDRKFNAVEDLAKLKEKLATLIQIKTDSLDVSEQLAKTSPSLRIEEVQAEITRIEEALNNSQEVRAREELIPFRINIQRLVEPLFA